MVTTGVHLWSYKMVTLQSLYSSRLCNTPSPGASSVSRTYQGRSQDFSLAGGGRSSAKGARIEAPRCGEGCPLPTRGGVQLPPQKFFGILGYIKMVSFRAFWVAINYHLAVCFIRIGNTCEIEIYWRSFRHFVNYNYGTLWKIARKNDKNAPKITKIALFFLYIFCIYSLNFLG